MKKIITLVLAFFLTFNLTNAEINLENTETSSGTITETWSVETGTGIPETETPPTSHLEEKSKTKYTYYYWDGCIHCAETDLFFKKNNIYDNFDIVKKEVWGNKDNALEMTQKVEELWIRWAGTPFIVVDDGEKEIWLVGTDQVKNYFLDNFPEIKASSEKNEEEEAKIQEEKAKNSDKNKNIILVILIILAVTVPTIFIKMSK